MPPMRIEGEAAVGGDEANWNPIEWDRAAEELTWERLLGLDGSLVNTFSQLFLKQTIYRLESLCKGC